MKLEQMYLYGEDHAFHLGSIEIEDGVITQVTYDSSEEWDENVPKKYVIPGLVDIHFHGCMGVDLCDALPDGISKMAEYEASVGVTSICPASMTVPVEELHRIMKIVGNYQEIDQKEENFQNVDIKRENSLQNVDTTRKKDSKKAHLVGINMEGPFISRWKKGAQAESAIIPCDVALFCALQGESGNRIKLVDLAPEEPGAMDFIEAVKGQVSVSIAHTVADYETSMAAFEKGANHVTHLYNAMPPYHHRDPGVIGAAADADAYVELICDGIHVHPSVIRGVFRTFSKERICMISDSMRATGLSDGAYTLGGQDVKVEGALATLADGTIAGSVTNLMDCLRYVVKTAGIPLEDAVRCVTENPARSIGIFDCYGSIAVGKCADLVILDETLEIVDVLIGK